MNQDTDEQGPPLPRENPDLEGQAEAESQLLGAFNAGKLPHAWLLCGPKGVGKATLAHRIARFVMSQAPADEPAGPGLFGDDLPASDPTSLYTNPESPLFRRVSAGAHADFLFIERSVDEKTGKRRKEIRVDEVREIGSFLSMTPAEGGWRAVVIDSADEMNANAANAVLKVLEEPPKKALLLLVSHNPGRLLPTIRSRCRRLMLHPLEQNVITQLLNRFAPEVNEVDAADLAELADGSVGRAIQLAEEGGLELYRDINELLAELPVLDIPGVHKLGDKLARDKTGDAFEQSAEMLNRWLVERIKANALSINAGNPVPSGLDPWIEVWEKTSRLFQQANGLNLDRKQVILNTFLSIEAAAQS